MSVCQTHHIQQSCEKVCVKLVGHIAHYAKLRTNFWTILRHRDNFEIFSKLIEKFLYISVNCRECSFFEQFSYTNSKKDFVQRDILNIVIYKHTYVSSLYASHLMCFPICWCKCAKRLNIPLTVERGIMWGPFCGVKGHVIELQRKKNGFQCTFRSDKLLGFTAYCTKLSADRHLCTP